MNSVILYCRLSQLLLVAFQVKCIFFLVDVAASSQAYRVVSE